jgi:nicotinamidase-related amidase
MARHPDILDRRTAILAVVDVQERIDPVMGRGGHRPRIRFLAQTFRHFGLPVLMTEQYPRGLGATVPQIAEACSEPPLVKMTFSCAEDEGFRSALAATGRRQVVLVGIEAHVCVAQTALDLLHAGYQVHVPHDAVSSRRPADRRRALDRLAHAGAIVTSTESCVFELLHHCGDDDFRWVSRALKEIPVESSHP